MLSTNQVSLQLRDHINKYIHAASKTHSIRYINHHHHHHHLPPHTHNFSLDILFNSKEKKTSPKAVSGLGPEQRGVCVLQITATVTVASVCAGVAGPESTATAPPAQTRASLRTECCAAGEGIASAASVFAQTLEPQDPPVKDVLHVVTPVTLNGNDSACSSPFGE
jgi:hypothetical protein